MNKASGSDGIPVELFQILKDDSVKVLHSICQKIWKTQQGPQDWKRSLFISIPKKGSAKECTNHHTIALISHASKVMLKILQDRLHSTLTELEEENACAKEILLFATKTCPNCKMAKMLLDKARFDLHRSGIDDGDVRHGRNRIGLA